MQWSAKHGVCLFPLPKHDTSMTDLQSWKRRGLKEAFEAVDTKDLPALINIFQHYILYSDIDSPHPDYAHPQTLLYTAVEHEYEEIIAFLLLHGANPHTKQLNGRVTPLSLICGKNTRTKSDRKLFIRTLLDTSINVNKPLGSFNYPTMNLQEARILYNGIISGSITDMTQETRLDINNMVHNRTPLMHAIECEMVYCVKYLIQKRGANPNEGLRNHWSSCNAPLSHAVWRCERAKKIMQNENVLTLLAHGADPIVADSETRGQSLRDELAADFWKQYR
jgi:hypothetical protein